jgi:hypothetical protein
VGPINPLGIDPLRWQKPSEGGHHVKVAIIEVVGANREIIGKKFVSNREFRCTFRYLHSHGIDMMTIECKGGSIFGGCFKFGHVLNWLPQEVGTRDPSWEMQGQRLGSERAVDFQANMKASS